MGKFQDVTLFGFGVESTDLIVTCDQVEAMSRHSPVNGGKFSKRARAARHRREVAKRKTHAAGIRTPMTLRVNKDELSWVAPSARTGSRVRVVRVHVKP